MDVFRRLPGLVFVENVEDLANKFAARILAEVLGDRDEFDAHLAQLPDIELRMQCVARKAAERMHDQMIEGMVRLPGPVDHLLKNRPVFVQCRSARFGKHLNHLPAALLTIAAALRDLIGQRQIGIGLPGGGNAHVDGGVDSHGRSACFVVAMDDGADFGGEEGAKQSDLLVSDGQVLGHVGKNIIAVWRVAAMIWGGVKARLGVGDFLLRLRPSGILSKTMLHLRWSTAGRR
nr:hypothetical protein [Mesorhizobium composti]